MLLYMNGKFTMGKLKSSLLSFLNHGENKLRFNAIMVMIPAFFLMDLYYTISLKQQIAGRHVSSTRMHFPDSEPTVFVIPP